MPTRVGLWLTNRLRIGRGPVRLQPAGSLAGLAPDTAECVARLRRRYGLRFESRLPRDAALENYVYLDLFDRLRSALAERWPLGATVLDVGSKSFHYAAALHAVLQPSRLTGIEVEGYRLFANLHNRHDYAMAHIAGLTDTDYEVGDVRRWQRPVGVVSCCYPFVFAEVQRAWGLPRSLFDPAGQFRAMAAALKPGGWLLMVNQGEDEAEAAAGHARGAGLACSHRQCVTEPLLPRPAPPVLSAWQRA